MFLINLLLGWWKMCKPFEIWYFNCLRIYVPCVSLKCLSGLTIQCSNTNTRIFVCVCMPYVLGFRTHQPVARIYKCLCWIRSHSWTEPFSFILKVILTCEISNFRRDKRSIWEIYFRTLYQNEHFLFLFSVTCALKAQNPAHQKEIKL